MSLLVIVSSLFSRFCSTTPLNSSQTLNDIFHIAKDLWSQQHYLEAYRLFHELGESHLFQSSLCAWYQIHCLTRLNQSGKAIQTCRTQIERDPQVKDWYILASDIYMENNDYIMAWDILNQVPFSCSEVRTKKRIAYEAAQRHRAPTRSDLIIQRMPYEIATILFGYLDFKSLVRCTRVSRQWRHFLIHHTRLWRDIEFSSPQLELETIKSYFNHRVTKLTISNYLDGNNLFTLLAQCQQLNTLVLENVVCTSTALYQALENRGPHMTSFQWGGICVRLNDLFDALCRHCSYLTHLSIHDCFTSMYDIRMPNGTPYRLETFGDVLPPDYINDILALPPLSHLTSLTLARIHGLTTSHLAHLLIRCPRLQELTLSRCLVDIIPILNMVKSFCSQLRSFMYDKNQCYVPLDDASPPELTDKKQQRFEAHRWRRLTIQYADALTDDLFHALVGPSAATIEHVDLCGSPYITDIRVAMCSLKSLHLGDCKGIKSDLSFLRHCRELQYLDLSSVSFVITDAVLDAMSPCKQLQTLCLTNTHIDVSEARYKAFIDERRHILKKLVLDHFSISKELLYYTMKYLKTKL